MSARTATTRLLRLALRRDRVVLPVWLLVIGGLAVATIGSIVGLYTTLEERVAAASFAASNVILRVFDGPAAGTELGALALMEGGWLLAVLTGLACAQAVIRHTRRDEELGRAELIGAAVVGRQARLTAALLLAGGLAIAVGAVLSASLIAFDLPWASSLLAGAALAGAGWVFAAVAALAAQVAASARAANASAGAVIGASWVLRAVGDAMGTVDDTGLRLTSAWPSWLSPIGWVQQVGAFDTDRWWVLTLPVVTALALGALAVAAGARRDLGAGLVGARPGPARAARSLSSPLGLAWRLHRTTLVAWIAAIAGVGAAFGAIGESADDLVGISADVAAALEATAPGAGLIDVYAAFAAGLLSIAASAFAVQAVLRARGEELDGRCEALLATAVSRHRLLAAHVTLALGGVFLLLVALGSAGSLGYLAASGDTERGWGMMAASLAHVPAALALGGIVVAAVGIAPRAAAAVGWSLLGVSLVFGQLGALFDLPQAVLNLSPFTHVPAVPAEAFAWTPTLWLLGVAAAAITIGFAAHRRRDLVLVS